MVRKGLTDTLARGRHIPPKPEKSYTDAVEGECTEEVAKSGFAKPLRMPIEYRRIRNITAREIQTALLRDGFELVRSTGSHRHYYHEATKRKVTVSWHGSGQTFRLVTLRSIIEAQAQWSEEDLIRLGLIRD